MEYPDIFTYDDYRPFLRDWFKARKRITGRVGTSAFARLAGCVPGHVQNVVAGRRKLQQELVPGFCQGLGIDADASEYLALLVRRAHPLSPVDRALAEKLLREARARHQTGDEGLGGPRARPRRVRGPVAQVAPPWSHPVIRALLAARGAAELQGWIASTLSPALSPLQVADALDQLDQGAHGGRPERPDQAVSLARLDPQDPASLAYHRDAIGVARWSLHHAPPSLTRFRASVWPVPSAQLHRLRALVEAFEEEVRGIFSRAARPSVRQASAQPEAADEPLFEVHGPPDVVYQLSVQVLPLSRRLDPPATGDAPAQ